MTVKPKTSSSTTDRVLAYAKGVVAGKIIAGPHVRNACRRHIDDLKKGKARGLRFEAETANRALRFFETKLRLSEGQFEGKPFTAHPAQAFIIGSLFGWQKLSQDHGWVRRFRRAYIEMGKGNGKSPLAGGIALYGLMADGEPGAEIYAAGATKDQAGILFRDAVKMVGQSAELASRLKASGGEGKEYNLAYLAKGSFFRPISREAKRTGSGPRPHMALCDEVHEHPDRGVMEMLERGFKFRRQPLLLMITNSGSDRNSICWEEHEHAIKVAAGNRDIRDGDATYLGEPVDDSTFSFVCSLDALDDPLIDPTCWPKANPLLGVTITEEYLTGVVAQARAMPGKLNGILRLHFCVWTDADTAWISRETLEPALVHFDPADYHGQRIGIGLDLSQTQDITAKACATIIGEVETEYTRDDGEVVTISKPVVAAWIEAWTPGDTVAARQLRDKAPYDVWIAQGHLQAPQGRIISYAHVAASVARDAGLYEAVLAYDRYAYKATFLPELESIGCTIEQVEHPQGGKKKGRPTDWMKDAAEAEGKEPEGLWMPGSVKAVEGLLLEGRLRLLQNPVLISAMMSAVTETDPWGNYWLSKERAVNKIDAAVALCMAVGVLLNTSPDGGNSHYEKSDLLVV
jgi:phage terminase large subunit-like protein